LFALGMMTAGCQGPEANVNPSSSRPLLSAAATADTARALSQLEPMLRRNQEALTGTSEPNGRHSVNLNSGFMHATMLRINPDGTRSAICTDSMESATEFFAGNATQAKLEEK
jgi:hypothetical protein